MSKVIYKIRLDAGKPGTQAQLYLKTGDVNSRELRAFLHNDGKPMTPEAGATVVLRAIKPDETMIYSDCALFGNVITYTFTEQFSVVPGIVECELNIYSGGGQVLFTPRFDIYVEPSVYSDDDIISSNEFNALIEAMNRVEELEETIAENEAEREQAEIEREAFIYGIEAEAETLAPGAAATTEIDSTDTSAIIRLGIPTGAEGPVGPQGEQGVQGETGPRGETGAGLALLGHFDTLAELEAAHPTGNPGDMYSVGTEAPRDIYQWSETTGAWVNEGPMGGGSGTVKSVNAVDPDEDGNIALTADDIPMAGGGSGSVGQSIGALDTIVAEHTDTLKATGLGQVLASTETEPGVYAARMRVLELDDLLLPGAGPHNSIYRGKYLGDAPTAAQYAAISSGTFDDLYIGDYWTIGGVNYRIGEFDRYLNCGDTPTTLHHATLVPDKSLYNANMNDTSVTTGGYMGTKMRTENLAQAKATISAAFPGHVMTHRQYLTNAVTNGRPSGGVWADSNIELMNEPMVYGGYIFAPANDGTSITHRQTIDKSQLPLFAMRPDLVTIRESYLLRDVISSTNFAGARSNGEAIHYSADVSIGVRPAFSIIG